MAERHTRDRKPSDTDLASDKMGKNALQGHDQESIHNQRHAQADVKQEPDENVKDSLEKMDKDKRAREELGKGNRSGDKPED